MEPCSCPATNSTSASTNSTSILSPSNLATMTLLALVGAALTPPEASLEFASKTLTHAANVIALVASTAWAYSPSALDFALLLALYNLYLWVKVRDLNPYGKA